MAQTQIRRKLAQVHFKEEASQDTYDNPDGDGTGMFLASDLTFTVTSDNHTPSYTRADFLSMDEVPGSRYATIGFRIPLKYSGTAGTASEYDAFLKSCGLEVTNVVSASDTYAPNSTFDGAGGNPGPSYSCTILIDGMAYAVGGAFSTFSFTATPGEPVFLDCQTMGQFQAVADDALEAPTYNTTVPPAFLGASITIGGATPTGVTEFSFDLGNVIRMGTDANEATGYYGARITSRQSTGSLTYESELVATRDDWGLWTAGTVGTITTGTIGGTAGNRWNLSCQRCVRRPPELSDQDGISMITMPFAVSSAATDVEGTNDDVTLAFS